MGLLDPIRFGSRTGENNQGEGYGLRAALSSRPLNCFGERRGVGKLSTPGEVGFKPNSRDHLRRT
eukprot:3741663-Heterocapsa_arctica.AAC.1